MKYLITNNSNYDELLDGEVVSPKESRVLENINISTLPSAFTAIEIVEKSNKELDSLGNSTSKENDISEVESNDEVVEGKEEVQAEGEITPEVAEATDEENNFEIDILSTLTKEELLKILASKNDEGCTYRKESKIVAYIRDTYPDLTEEEIKSIIKE